jgi:hypothetical protein
MAEARAAHQAIVTASEEEVCDVAVDLADAIARCFAEGVEQPLLRAPLSWSQRARLSGVFDPVPSSLEISVYADEGRSDPTLGFYLIALEQGDEISHGEHRTLSSAVAAATAEYGTPRTAWVQAS